MSNAPADRLSVEYQTVDAVASATDGDYAATSGILTWEAGDSSDRRIRVQVHGDTTWEGDESYLVALTRLDGIGVAKKYLGVGTILDDDPIVYDAPADGQDNTLELEFSGPDLVLRRNGEIVLATTVALESPITVTGAAGVVNSLTIRSGNGEPPQFRDVTFHGAGTGSLTLVDMLADVVSHGTSGPSTGSIDLAGFLVEYDGTSTLIDKTSAASRTFAFDGPGSQTVILGDCSEDPGMSLLRSEEAGCVDGAVSESVRSSGDRDWRRIRLHSAGGTGSSLRGGGTRGRRGWERPVDRSDHDRTSSGDD